VLPTPGREKTKANSRTSAYEIKTFHGKEPPPKELVEDRSAAGGPIMTRTFENTPPEGSPGTEAKEEDTSVSPTAVNATPAVTTSSGRSMYPTNLHQTRDHLLMIVSDSLETSPPSTAVLPTPSYHPSCNIENCHRGAITTVPPTNTTAPHHPSDPTPTPQRCRLRKPRSVRLDPT